MVILINSLSELENHHVQKGKSIILEVYQCLSSLNGQFSIALLNNQRTITSTASLSSRFDGRPLGSPISNPQEPSVWRPGEEVLFLGFEGFVGLVM